MEPPSAHPVWRAPKDPEPVRRERSLSDTTAVGHGEGTPGEPLPRSVEAGSGRMVWRPPFAARTRIVCRRATPRPACTLYSAGSLVPPSPHDLSPVLRQHARVKTRTMLATREVALDWLQLHLFISSDLVGGKLVEAMHAYERVEEQRRRPELVQCRGEADAGRRDDVRPRSRQRTVSRDKRYRLASASLGLTAPRWLCRNGPAHAPRCESRWA